MFSVKRAAGVIGLPTDAEATAGDSNVIQILKRLRTILGTIFDTASSAMRVTQRDSAGNDATDPANQAVRVNVVAGGAGGGIAQNQVETALGVWTNVGPAPGATTMPVDDGGGSLTVDGTVNVQQAVPANLQATVRQVDSAGVDATDPVNQAVRVNVVAGGAGGGVVQAQIRDAAGAWDDVGNDAPSQSVPVNDKGGSLTVDQAVPANLQATVTPAVGSTFDVSDRAARDNGKVDVASLDQYTPIDLDTGAPVVNGVPVTWRKSAAGAPEFGTAGDPVRTDPTGTTVQPVLQQDSGGGDPTDPVNHAIIVIQGDLADLDSGVGTDNHLLTGAGMAAPGGHAVPVAVDMDTGAGTDYGAMPVVLTVPGAGGKAVAGVAGVPIRTDPTGTTKQPITVADGDDVATGAVADAIVAAGAVGSISAKLRRVTQGLEDLKTAIVVAAGAAIIGKVGIDQTTPGTTDSVTVATGQGSGAAIGLAADAIVAAGAVGTLSAKLRRVTQGLEDLKTTIVLAAGSAAIGKLAANSGVDIGDVDVTSLPATPAGTNLIGRVSASPETSTVYNATTALTPKFAFANVAASQTDSSIVAAVGGKKIRVLAAVAICGGTATNITFNTKPAGAGSAISMLFANGANGGAVLPFSPVGWFETVSSEGLTVTTGAGSTTGVQVVYVEV